ncbi:MAG TPA: HlyD family efflux transporter periplasmic adaptor subunit [Bacteroidales bacterium]|nr:HlyD family efflux transporter periplasmic adaptor subunit [Bacteroidales bacterium]HOM41780.1 HlyD family efflux transporter periplasmic adaptor subunit [Bacteroidales bacterium]HPP93587.1 HlyD family efflux transporter periplasmic adaptor subunit [Bacteroidales bacterium]HRR17352.1 HlyD family efflux transporter periplasmic adaptor subunit [Bacteroidales bacterium]HRU57829.1 HlyD family efflux transporter periplasmic adaptor subunit [Bacteroidales bacterium]
MKIIPFPDSNNLLESYLFRIRKGSRVIYWIIILAVAAAIIVLPFVFVDISVQARGFFQPDIEKQFVFAPAGGKVIFSSVKSGKRVSKGDTLLIIDSETIRSQKAGLAARIAENNFSMSDLRKLVLLDSDIIQKREISLQSSRYASEFDDLYRQYSVQLQKVQKAQSEFDRNSFLYSQSLIPQAEYENSRYQLSVESENLRRIVSSAVTGWQYDLNQRRNDSVRMVAEYCHYNEELSNRVVTTPVAGEIVISSDIQEGSTIAANQKILEISPEGELLANVLVKPADIGFIREGQHVRIQVDAFRYNEWGMIEGEIIDVSDDLFIEGNTGAFFRVRCRLKNHTLSLKNGYTAIMKKGMSINARIIVTRRSLFNLLFDRIHKWLNPYMNNPENKSNEV